MKNKRILKCFLVFGLWFLAGCASDSKLLTAVNSQNQNNAGVKTNINANVSVYDSYVTASRENDRIVEELEAQNERFKTVPAEFQKVDFNNFTYPTEYPKKSVTLKDGELEYETGYASGGSFNFSRVYYVDLTGDNQKEAFVFLHRVDCGASCDGGTYLLYVYSSINQKPSLIWRLDLGSGAYDCGLKSLTVKDKKIHFEVFDNCFEKGKKLEIQPDHPGKGKGSSYGLTEFIYKFNGKTFVREKMQFGQPQDFEHRSYSAPISIND